MIRLVRMRFVRRRRSSITLAVHAVRAVRHDILLVASSELAVWVEHNNIFVVPAVGAARGLQPLAGPVLAVQLPCCPRSITAYPRTRVGVAKQPVLAVQLPCCPRSITAYPRTRVGVAKQLLQ